MGKFICVFYIFFCLSIRYVVGKTSLKKLLLVSLDGLRWDFSKLGKTPTLDWIKENGVTSRVMNVFPTNTIPNHQSIVTGLYPESHGMINNNFLDRKNKRQFSILLNDSSWWYQSKPIWIENEEQGHKSGVIYWPGFNVKYGNKLASHSTATEDYSRYQIPFSANPNKIPLDYYTQIELAFKWLRIPDVNFVALYSAEPDSCFHSNGPDKIDSDHDIVIQKCVSFVDNRVKSIANKIKENKNISIDTIFIGDHGHVNLNSSNVEWLDNYVNMSYIDNLYGSTSVLIYTHYPSIVYNQLKGKSQHFEVFLKDKIPDKFHFKNNERAPDVLIVGEPGWAILNKLSKPWFFKENEKWSAGDHGYSNYVRDMNPGLYAFGPSFKKNFTTSNLEVVDIYELACNILDIKPHANNGSSTRIKKLLLF